MRYREMPVVAASPGDVEALIAAVGAHTPLEAMRWLGARVLAKREDLGPNRAFKWRGALCAAAALQRGGAENIVTASTGNHGAACAWAAKRLGMTADVFAPSNVSSAKAQLIVANGARLHREGAGMRDAAVAARHFAEVRAAPYFEDGACPPQLDGTWTIGREIARARPGLVVMPLACGALAAGVARALSSLTPRPRLIGVQARPFSRIAQLFAGCRDPGDEPAGTTFADGLADSRLVSPAWPWCAHLLDDVIVVEDHDLRQAIREVYAQTGVVLEGAGAASVAGLRALGGGHVTEVTVVIFSGGNLSGEQVEAILGRPAARQ